MAWYVLSSTHFDFERFARESEAGNLPQHLLPQVAARLGTEVVQPRPGAGNRLDRLASRLYGRPEHWAQARSLLPRLSDGDAVYTAGPDSGIPVALLCAIRRRDVTFVINFADVTRLRTRVFGWILSVLLHRLVALVTTHDQAEAVRRDFGRRLAGVHVIEGQTDCGFFHPPDERAPNERPLVASCGAESRDYALLAAAVAPLDVQVQVCFTSPNLTDKTRYTMPDIASPDVEFRKLDFAELRRLYQRADVVVVPLLPNPYSAGLTTLFEAIACEAPVVVTESPGIIRRLIDEGLVLGVPAGDADALTDAIRAVLADPLDAAARAQKARTEILERYSSSAFLDRIERVLDEVERR